MRTFLLMLAIGMAFCRAQGQIPGATSGNNDCDADFSANPDPVNPMLFHFQDQSSGQITSWQWSFGDGATSTVRDPVHMYLQGGTYFVCLTISNADSGYICHDVLCSAITVHEPGACVADYDYTADPLNPMKIHFIDQSGGNINSWHWDFGDGSFSDENSPTHIFPLSGKFRVCLTAYNADSVAVCNDVKCDSLTVSTEAGCKALFTARLDSLNPVPNTFIFYNNSAGEPNQYIWTFDDGATYLTRHVTHHFQSDGQHEVCLIISREIHGTIVCTDTLCQNIATAKYFDLGGHLFTGAYPINNPVSTGDTGIATLYRIVGPNLNLYGSAAFTHMGYFAFPKILNGHYIVRASLTPGSLNYRKYFPAYDRNALFWKEADILDLSDGNAFACDIHLPAANDSISGPCTITGRVVESDPADNFDGIPNAGVILFDTRLEPVVYAISGKSGLFGLTNIPYGAYQLYVELPGKYSRFTPVWLDPSTPARDSIVLEVFDHDVTSIHDLKGFSLETGYLFPNPTGGELNFITNLAKPATLKCEIRNLTGTIIWSGSSDCPAGHAIVAIPVRDVSPGYYLFIVSKPDGAGITVKKLLRY